MIDKDNIGAGGDERNAECKTQNAELGIGAAGFDATSPPSSDYATSQVTDSPMVHPPSSDFGATNSPQSTVHSPGPEATVHPATSDFGATSGPKLAGMTDKTKTGSRVRRRRMVSPDDEEVDFRRLRKLREDSKWNQLTAEERQRLESWLFEKNLGYAKIVARVKTEFDLETTTTSVYRYYRRRMREKQVEELVEGQLTANELNGLAVDAGSLRTAAVKLVGNAVMKMAGEKREDLELLTSLTELLLEAEQNDLRRGRLKLAQQYFEYEATAASLKEFPQFRAYMQVIQHDDSLTIQEKITRIQRMLNHWQKPKSRKVK